MSTIREYTIALRDHIIITVCIKIDREFIARAANRIIINEPLSAINAARRNLLAEYFNMRDRS